METTIKRWGDSQGVIISKTMLAKMGIDDLDDQLVKMHIDGKGRLIIEKKKSPSKLEERFIDFDVLTYSKKVKHGGELDWGKPNGDEI